MNINIRNAWDLVLEGVEDTLCNPGNNGMRAMDHVILDMMLARVL